MTSKGPWKWTGNALRADDGSTVLDIEIPSHCERDEVWFVVGQDDAALIAAAPELLATLQRILKTGRDGYGHAARLGDVTTCQGCQDLIDAEALLARLSPSQRDPR